MCAEEMTLKEELKAVLIEKITKLKEEQIILLRIRALRKALNEIDEELEAIDAKEKELNNKLEAFKAGKGEEKDE